MSHDPDDKLIVDRIAVAQRGDPAAFDELVRVLERPLVGFLRARHASDPESLANEVLVRVFSGIGGFEGGAAQFRAWVFRIARNLLIDERRREGRQPQTVPTAPAYLPEPGYGEMPFDRLDEAERVAALLAKVSDEQREVLVLRIVAGLSVEETARVLGSHPGAVRALQHRALRRLRQEFSKTP